MEVLLVEGLSVIFLVEGLCPGRPRGRGLRRDHGPWPYPYPCLFLDPCHHQLGRGKNGFDFDPGGASDLSPD